MPYDNWTSRHTVLTAQSWYDAEQLVRVLCNMRTKNFSIQEARNQCLSDLNALRSTAPFSKMQRFPDDAVYVTEAFGDWGRQFAQLKSACSFKNRGAEVRGHMPDESERRAESDAQQAFWNATTKMLEELNRANTLIDRDMFERWERLTWT